MFLSSIMEDFNFSAKVVTLVSKSIDKEKMTVMIIPHSEKSVKELQLSLKWLKWAGYVSVGGAVATVIVATAMLISYFDMKENMVELKELREVNKAQQNKLALLSEETASIQEELAKVQELDAEIRKMLGMKSEQNPSNREVPVSRSGYSRSTENTYGLMSNAVGFEKQNNLVQMDEMHNTVQGIMDELTQRQQSLEEVKAAVAKRNAILAATPSIMPARGRVTSAFGYRTHPITRRRTFHEGIDIAAPVGTPVYATASGKVIFSGWKDGYGRTIIIDHGYGYKTLYGHNYKLLVKSGQKVTKGQQIAKMGSSGSSTGPHVHYEVWVNGVKTNPRKYY
jgi:murein DD-endopeptidase MepM/ murein hydrolase activator NlpD